MKGTIKSGGLAALTISALLTMNCTSDKTSEGYIGPSQIEIKDGKMTPEALLAFGRLSDPQLSPDGKTILYGVSYTSIADNRSCRNLFLVNADGTSPRQLTRDGKSISCARWCNDGKSVAYVQGGQIWKADVRGLSGEMPSLVRRQQISDVKEGVGEFKFSPDESKVLYVSYVHFRLCCRRPDVPPLGPLGY
jgi:dipeptidyl aminopeptidase/acylaminoacyl peptidase